LVRAAKAAWETRHPKIRMSGRQRCDRKHHHFRCASPFRSAATGSQKTAQLREWEIDQGEDAVLQRFAAETLPNVAHHLELAQRAHAELTGAAMR